MMESYAYGNTDHLFSNYKMIIEKLLWLVMRLSFSQRLDMEDFYHWFIYLFQASWSLNSIISIIISCIWILIFIFLIDTGDDVTRERMQSKRQ